MIEATEMSKATPADRFIAALVGREKSGKSRLAATARKPILFLDEDNRRESIAGIDGVYALSFRDAAWPKSPTAISETLDVIGSLEKSLALCDIEINTNDGAVKPFKNVPPDVKVRTLVDDSITSMAQFAMGFALFSNKDLRREVNVGGKFQVHTPYSYDGWGVEMNIIQSIIMRQLAIPNLDVIAILHEAEEEAKDSTDKNPRFTGKVTIFPARYARTLRYFNEVWRVVRTGQVPQVRIIPEDMSGGFLGASTSLPITQDVVNQVGPNIAAILAKCGLK